MQIGYPDVCLDIRLDVYIYCNSDPDIKTPFCCSISIFKYIIFKISSPEYFNTSLNVYLGICTDVQKCPDKPRHAQTYTDMPRHLQTVFQMRPKMCRCAQTQCCDRNETILKTIGPLLREKRRNTSYCFVVPFLGFLMIKLAVFTKN